MKLIFKQLHIHHFMSFDDAVIDLTDKGFCLVSGINNCKADASKSNGAGKSTIWNAISYALTGETVQGLKSNLSNNYFNDGCYVDLVISVDDTEYHILRSKDDETYGTNLKIFTDSKDLSGKGIKESSAILKSLFPDLTSELLGAVIILGQGLPQKFSSNTPAGRKEVLEHLSKSDFMIADIRQRVADRGQELNLKYREYKNKKEVNAQSIEFFNTQLAARQEAYQKLSSENVASLKNKCAEMALNIENLSGDIATNEAKEQELFTNLSETNKKLQELVAAKSEKLALATNNYNSWIADIKKDRALYNSYIANLDKEITRLKSITDICPTCGQKIHGIEKPSTVNQELELESYKNILKEIDEDESIGTTRYHDAIAKINNEYNNSIDEATKLATNTEIAYNKLKSTLKYEHETLLDYSIQKDTINRSIETYEQQVKTVEDEINSLQNKIMCYNNDNNSLSEKLADIEARIAINDKMSTAIKRDFRGILLSETIDYINRKAKEYCSKIFNTDELSFSLDGNNINIVFQNKNYENLSGGEKQRIDLIIQFAIRDMLCEYNGLACNILVLDEITDNLDSVSCDKVVTFIMSELADIDSVFIISHHASELNLGYDSELVIEKDERGVSRV